MGIHATQQLTKRHSLWECLLVYQMWLRFALKGSFVIQSFVDVVFGGHIHMITMVTELISTRQISVTVICIYNAALWFTAAFVRISAYIRSIKF